MTHPTTAAMQCPVEVVHDIAYYRPETRADRLRRFSNIAADLAARAMEVGFPEANVEEFAEMADEIAAVADFIDPEPEYTLTVTLTDGAVTGQPDGWVFNVNGEYGTVNADAATSSLEPAPSQETP